MNSVDTTQGCPKFQQTVFQSLKHTTISSVPAPCWGCASCTRSSTYCSGLGLIPGLVSAACRPHPLNHFQKQKRQYVVSADTLYTSTTEAWGSLPDSKNMSSFVCCVSCRIQCSSVCVSFSSAWAVFVVAGFDSSKNAIYLIKGDLLLLDAHNKNSQSLK